MPPGCQAFFTNFVPFRHRTRNDPCQDAPAGYPYQDTPDSGPAILPQEKAGDGRRDQKADRQKKALRGYLWVRLSIHHFIVRMMDELNWYA